MSIDRAAIVDSLMNMDKAEAVMYPSYATILATVLVGIRRQGLQITEGDATEHIFPPDPYLILERVRINTSDPERYYYATLDALHAQGLIFTIRWGDIYERHLPKRIDVNTIARVAQHTGGDIAIIGTLKANAALQNELLRELKAKYVTFSTSGSIVRTEHRRIIFASTDRGLIGYSPSMIILNAYPMSIGSLRIAKETKARVHLLASS